MLRRIATAVLLVVLCSASVASAADKLKVLIVDGQNNHNWRATTPVMNQWLESSGHFTVEVATSPQSGDLSGFRPKFEKYDAVLSNYNGKPWPEETQKALVDYVKGGGGLVVVHAANNSFPGWDEYNRMIGLGGWGGRNETSGPYVYLKDDKVVRDESKGSGGHHGRQHAFQVIVRDPKHPVTQGMPRAWMHNKDELYDYLRGPAVNMNILATAYADPSTGGSGRHEPMIFTVDYGQGRVFHTPMGHADYSMKCTGFGTTLIRGTEWAATGKVTTKIPQDFPSADEVSVRE